jgi:hypothetical protein
LKRIPEAKGLERYFLVPFVHRKLSDGGPTLAPFQHGL